jgi:hypothetical protein
MSVSRSLPPTEVSIGTTVLQDRVGLTLARTGPRLHDSGNR